ncbi:UNVERIFIED_CONTAM: hypothetical protein GTU68_014596 [Idotea baltica]|nr:hypothetical protein [Idotea baltica]
MSITAADVKKLREQTGAGMMDCKKALNESNGNLDDAIDFLRKQGLKDVAKRSGKVAAEGVVNIYAHPGGQVAAIVELNCETDFVARGDDFNDLAKGIAMHIAAMKPAYANQPYIKDDSGKNTVSDALNELSAKIGEKITLRRFARFEVGEGVEKVQEDLAAAVAETISGSA